ncbi:DoxX family protein [Streptosporangium sp. NPDC006930]|uniref:DoxX family protein n=1 Tax=unclassified Streptosporangium TaxID=2632669 RepID=UPI00343799A8
MTHLPDPVWPVVVLAFIQVADAILCIRPVAFVAQCLEDVKWPRRHWWVMSPIKFAAAAGLLAGIWIPYLGAVTCAALVLYFLVAISMHVAARDFGRNLFLNATGMLVICLATGVFCFVIR